MSRFEEVSLIDNFGFQNQFTPMRDMKVTEPFRMVGTTFGASIDTFHWTATNNGAGSASGVANSIATLTSGTANDGYGQLLTAQQAGFEFAHPLMFRAAIRITDVTIADCTRRWGGFNVSGQTPANGFCFSLDGAGTLSINSISDSSSTSVESGSFNGDVDSYVVDTNVHAYEIIFFTMGAWFYIDDVLIHKITPTTVLMSESNDVCVALTSINSATGTTSGTMECWNGIIIKLGREITSPVSWYQAGLGTKLLKIGFGTVHSLAVSNTSNNAVITLYDNTAASGTILWSSGSMGANAVPFNVDLHGVGFTIGLALQILTANANATVIFE